MQEPRYWFKAVKLPCALEQAVLRVSVFEREQSWTIPLYRDVNGVEEAATPDLEVENGLIIPPEDPLLQALDRIRQHHDEAVIGNVLLRCWGALAGGVGAAGRNGSTASRPTHEEEAAVIHESFPKKDRAIVFEISDGIQTEIDGMLRDLELVGKLRAVTAHICL